MDDLVCFTSFVSKSFASCCEICDLGISVYGCVSILVSRGMLDYGGCMDVEGEGVNLELRP